MAPKALEGVRVLEYGSFIAAPFASRLMADLGAQVIKVEPPDGDRSRAYGPFPYDVPESEASGLFLHLNASKQGVTLDIASASGARMLKALLATADIFLENCEPGYLESIDLGVGATAARAMRASLHRALVASIVTKLPAPATTISISARGMNRRYEPALCAMRSVPPAKGRVLPAERPRRPKASWSVEGEA